MRILFRLGKLIPPNGTLFIRLRCNGQRCKTDIGTGLRFPANLWQSDRQEVKNRPDLNQVLNHTRQELTAIYLELAARGPVDVEQWRSVYVARRGGGAKLLDVFRAFLEEKKPVRVKGRHIPRTHQTHVTRFNLLRRYLEGTKQTEIYAHNVKHDFGRCFLEWLYGEGYKMNYAAKQIQTLGQVLTWAEKKGIIRANGLAGFSAPVEPPGYPLFLSLEEFGLLSGAVFVSVALRRTADLFIFQCLTGLAFAELWAFERGDVKEYRGREYIYIDRQKSGSPSRIPRHPRAAAILAAYPEGLPKKKLQVYNREIKNVLAVAGLPEDRARRFSSHNARKTAGMHWLNAGFSAEAVADMLGHKNTRVTLSTYARVLPERIFREADSIKW